MGGNTIKTLSTELGLTILCLLSSPRDVLSTICSSSFFLQIYKTYRSLILATVIQRSFPSLNLSDAIFACDASEVSSCTSRSVDWAAAIATTKRPPFQTYEFVRHHRASLLLEQRQQGEARLQDFSLLTRLCRLWFVVDYFVEDYAQRSLVRIQSLTRSDLPNDAPRPLLDDERSRIQRAFLRFEDYRRLFSPLDQDIWGLMPFSDFKEQYPLLSRWSQCELEELSCVYLYLRQGFETVISNMQDAFRDDIKGLTKQEKKTKKRVPLDWYDLPRSAKMNRTWKNLWQSTFLVELGLPFIKHVLGLNANDQMQAIQSVFPIRYTISLGHVIQAATYYKTHTITRELQSVFWDEDRQAKAGLLWLPDHEIKSYRLLESSCIGEEPKDMELGKGVLPRAMPDVFGGEGGRDWLESIEY